MNNKVQFFILALVFSIILSSCTEKGTNIEVGVENQNPSSTKIIFETDMGNDIDDALALDMLYKYADQGKAEILAITLNKNNEYAVRYIDILNTWYGYPQIPIGKVVNGADSESDSKNFAQATWEYSVEGDQVFKGSHSDYSEIPEAVNLFREILSQQPDNSVTIISVGFSTNLERLLKTHADRHSDLSGKELVAKKVKLLSVMAGNFENSTFAEYNVKVDIGAARTVFLEWPTKIIISPWEVGNAIKYPATSIENDFEWATHHPVVVAYENYMSMPYDRPTWDLTSVLYAIEGNEGYFNMSEKGKVSVDENGFTSFSEDSDGQHQYLKVSGDQPSKIKERFIELITSKPKSQN